MQLKMTIDECLEFSDEWSRGMTIHEGSQGWRVVCMLLAEEVRMLRKGECICIKCGLRQDGEHADAMTANDKLRGADKRPA